METALVDRLVAHCQKARFTGILRIRAREGIGEIWFLSGMEDEIHFGTSTADEAMERMRKATDATFELVSRLPHPGGGFKQRFLSKGSIATATPVTLMRYCERYALTCTLAVESKGVLVEATYELGDLVTVETTADDDGITAMLEATEGTYEFILPRVELPEGTPVLPPTSLRESMAPPESLAFRALLEAKPAVGRPASDEAEVKRKTVEIAHRPKKAPTTATVPRPAAVAKIEPKPAAEPEKPKAEKVEPEKKVEAAKEEEKPAEPKPATEPVESEPDSEPEPEPDSDSDSEPDSDSDSDSEPDSEPARAPAPVATKNGSWSWLVVSILVAAAVGYLFWTHRI